MHHFSEFQSISRRRNIESRNKSTFMLNKFDWKRRKCRFFNQTLRKKGEDVLYTQISSNFANPSMYVLKVYGSQFVEQDESVNLLKLSESHINFLSQFDFRLYSHY
jgi:hypothetical protein